MNFKYITSSKVTKFKNEFLKIFRSKIESLITEIHKLSKNNKTIFYCKNYIYDKLIRKEFNFKHLKPILKLIDCI